MLKKLLKVCFIVGIFGVMFTGCVIVEDCCDSYDRAYMDIYVSDTIVYDNGYRYQALYAELLGEKIYTYKSFLLDEGYSYKLKYAYTRDDVVYIDYVDVDLYTDVYVTLRGNMIKMEY